tara:strand:- start:12 stop:248 length:237 start_codon:yes stop_codon:yes gene_type:complete
MQLTQVIALRSEFEFLTKGYNMPEGSDINTLKWFIENGHRSNSLRNGFKEAMEIAKKIKEYADGCTKNTRTRKQVRRF